MSEVAKHVSRDDPAWSDMTKRVAIEIAIVQARGGSLMEQSRVAIEVMRIPTDAMVNAAMDCGSVSVCYGEVETRYQAMIDEALK